MWLVVDLLVPISVSVNASDRFGYIPSDVQKLIERLHSDESPSSRAMAFRSLANKCHPAAKDAIRGALNDKSSAVQSAAKTAIVQWMRNCDQ